MILSYFILISLHKVRSFFMHVRKDAQKFFRPAKTGRATLNALDIFLSCTVRNHEVFMASRKGRLKSEWGNPLGFSPSSSSVVSLALLSACSYKLEWGIYIIVIVFAKSVFQHRYNLQHNGFSNVHYLFIFHNPPKTI